LLYLTSTRATFTRKIDLDRHSGSSSHSSSESGLLEILEGIRERIAIHINPASEQIRTVHQVSLTELHDSRAESRGERSGTRSLDENLGGSVKLYNNLNGLCET
jgi:hypothetical protein